MNRGFAVGIDSTILATTDGGTTWQTVKAPLSQRSFYDVALQGPTGWIVGDAGTILKTTDAGASWAVEPVSIKLAANWIRSLSLSPTGAGLAVGSEGLVFRIDGTKLERLEGRRANAPEAAS